MNKEKKCISNSVKIFIQVIILSILGFALVLGYYKSNKTQHFINMSDNIQNISSNSRDELYTNYGLLQAIIYKIESTPDFQKNDLYNIFKQNSPKSAPITKLTLSDTKGKVIYVLDESGIDITNMYKGLPIQASLVEVASSVPISELDYEMKPSIYSDKEIDILYPLYKKKELSGFFSLTIDAENIFKKSSFDDIFKDNRIAIRNLDGSTVFKSKGFSEKSTYVDNIKMENVEWIVSIQSKEDVIGIISKKAMLLALLLISLFSFLIYLEWQLLNKGAHIKELTILKKEFENIASSDSLTGLSNRFGITNQISQHIECIKQNSLFAIIFLDLDDFKDVNDIFGHDKGDKLLQSVGSLLKKLYYTDHRLVSSRIGGDEFIVFFKDINSEKEVHCFCNDLLNSISNITCVDNDEINISASMGVSLFPYSGNNVETLFKNADVAMYNAKSMGKNQYRFFGIEMGEILKRKLSIGSKLRTLVNNNNFEPFSIVFQPQVHVSECNELESAEALIRWTDSELGFISPVEFIKIAEDTGTISELGNWVLRETCKYLKKLELDFGLKQNISVNISPEQFRVVDFVEKVISIVKEEDICTSQITIEITEQVFIDNMFECTKILNYLKEYGFKIALDDFGTGYSSLSYLSRLPIDILKIDKSFVDNIESDNHSLSIVKGICQLSHSINLKVIVEGVETVNQYDLLKEVGVDTIQGYYFSKPLTPEDYILYSTSTEI